MKWSTRAEAIVALAAGVTGVGASFLLAGLRTSFVVLAVDRVFISVAPGWLVAAVIQRVGKTGHLLHQIPATLSVVGIFAAVAFVGLRVGQRTDTRLLGGVVAGVAASVVSAVFLGVSVAAAAPGVGVGVITWLAPTPASPIDPVDLDRRSVIQATTGAAITLGLGGVIQAVTSRSPPPRELPGGSAEPQDMLDTAADQSMAIEGIEPLVSNRFYEVDINPTANPVVSADDWSLSVTGAVENEYTITYDELTSLDREHRFLTLRCVSDEINGNLMDTAVWTGVPASVLVDRASPQSGCECVMLRAADGYFEEFPLPALEPGLIAYGMNAERLPRNHGYPVRALVPGHWGEVNVKWLTEIEVLDEPATGYWERRDWHGTGPVHTVAKLHAVNERDDGRIELGGHAYAGTRGIDRVEVSTDGGATWSRAELSSALPGDDVWRQWRYEFGSSGGHEVVVRAVDGTGTVQPREEADPFPRGSTGWVTQEIG